MTQRALECLRELMGREDFHEMIAGFVGEQKPILLELIREQVRNNDLHNAMGFQGQLTALESLPDLLRESLALPRG